MATFNPYETSDAVLSSPEMVKRRLYWSTHNDFTRGQRASYSNSSGNTAAPKHMMGNATLPSGGGFGNVGRAGVRPDFNRLGTSPADDIGRMDNALNTGYNLFQGARAARAFGTLHGDGFGSDSSAARPPRSRGVMRSRRSSGGATPPPRYPNPPGWGDDPAPTNQGPTNSPTFGSKVKNWVGQRLNNDTGVEKPLPPQDLPF